MVIIFLQKVFIVCMIKGVSLLLFVSRNFALKLL